MNWKLVYIVYRLWCSCVWYLVVPLAGNPIRVDCRLLVANIAELFLLRLDNWLVSVWVLSEVRGGSGPNPSILRNFWVLFMFGHVPGRWGGCLMKKENGFCFYTLVLKHFRMKGVYLISKWTWNLFSFGLDKFKVKLGLMTKSKHFEEL